MPRVNPEILRWARETASLSSDEAIKKLQLRAARGISARQRLAALESGDEEPTRPMLVRMSVKYRRPLLTFYLSAPPKRGDRGQDFRTLPDNHTAADDALLDVLIRDIRARQSMVRAVLEDEEDVEPLHFIGSMAMSSGISAITKSIRQTLKFNLNDYRKEPTTHEAFALLRTRAEEVGVFVILKGDLGSYHTAIDLQIFRGFSVADEIAPFIIINDQDSKAAWSFTLLHELSHLWLGQTGVSGVPGDLAIEQLCSDVASEILLPVDELLQHKISAGMEIHSMESQISNFARYRKISASMVAYKLYRNGVIDFDKWQLLSTAYRDRWLQDRQRRRILQRTRRGGPSRNVVHRHRLGKALIDLVGSMTLAGSLTTSKAGKVLGVRAKSVQALLFDVGRISAQGPA